MQRNESIRNGKKSLKYCVNILDSLPKLHFICIRLFTNGHCHQAYLQKSLSKGKKMLINKLITRLPLKNMPEATWARKNSMRHHSDSKHSYLKEKNIPI